MVRIGWMSTEVDQLAARNVGTLYIIPLTFKGNLSKGGLFSRLIFFRIDEEVGKLSGDILGLPDAAIAEAAGVEKGGFELKVQRAGPSFEGPAQEKLEEMDELSDGGADVGSPKKPCMGQTNAEEVGDEEMEADDRGSLFSEHPSDEDGEPEWLLTTTRCLSWPPGCHRGGRPGTHPGASRPS